MVQPKPKKIKKTSKAKSKAFNDMHEEGTYCFLPFDRWLNRYVFS